MRSISVAPFAFLGVALILSACPPPSTPDLGKSSVTVDRATGVVADGTDQVVITVTVRDAAGKPVSGQPVTISVTGQQNSVSSPARTDGAGVTTATLTSRTAELKTVTAALAEGDLPDHPSVTFMAGPPSALKSTVSAQPTSAAADGLASVAINVVLRDANDNLVPSAQVQLSATGAANTLVQPGPTDLNGVTSGTLSSTRAETKRVTAVATVTGGADVTLLQQPLIQFISSDVTCAQTVHYVTRAGVTDRPGDLTDAPIGAYVAAGDGGYTYYPGTATVTGTCLIPNVPQGRHLFRYGTNYVETSARFIDLSLSFQGRPDKVRADAGTYLDLDLSNLVPIARRDYLLGHSFDTDLYNPVFQAGLPEGSTAGPISLNWEGAPLLDATKGDAVTFTQLSAKNPPEFPTPDGGPGPRFYRGATRFYQASVTMADGTTTTLDAGMTAVPQSTATLGWKLSPATPGSFWSLTSQVHPSAYPYSLTFYAGPLVDGTRGYYGTTPRILWLSWIMDGTEPDLSITATWGNPFPPQYEVFARTYALYEVAHTYPMTGGGIGTAYIDVNTTLIDRISSFPLASMQPAIGPVSAPLLNGADFFANRSGVGTAPVVSWNPPAIGMATYYSVDIFEVDTTIDTYFKPFNFAPNASVQTTLTQVKLPPILVPGKYYVLSITAHDSPGHDAENRPFELQWPTHVAQNVSGLLSP